MTPKTTWHGCYDDSWKGEIVEAAFAHPAKMARGLVRRIFDHLLLATGRLTRGDTVIDPFGGIGTTGLEGASRGVRCLSCELEPRFVTLAQANYDLHRKTWEVFGDPLPVIVQGDSRRLRQVLGPVLAECVVGSPPFIESLATNIDTIGFENITGNMHRKAGKTSPSEVKQSYGTTPGQLGAMPSGSVDAVVSSPPYEGSLSNGTISEAMKAELASRGHKPSASGESADYGDSPGNIGNDTGNTFWSAARQIVAECHAILKPGGTAVWVTKDFVRNKARVPFSADWVRLCESQGFRLVEWIEASLVKTDSHPSLFGGQETKTTERKSFFRRLAEKKGSPRIDHEDVLVMERLPTGTETISHVSAVIGSPPYASSEQSRDPDFTLLSTNVNPTPRNLATRTYFPANMTTPGQLAAMKPGSLDDTLTHRDQT